MYMRNVEHEESMAESHVPSAFIDACRYGAYAASVYGMGRGDGRRCHAVCGDANAGFEQTTNGEPDGWKLYETVSVAESVYQPVHDGGFAVNPVGTTSCVLLTQYLS
jgi:hypothetical protein